MVSIILSVLVLLLSIALYLSGRTRAALQQALEKEKDDKAFYRELYRRECELLSQQRADLIHLLTYGVAYTMEDNKELEVAILGAAYNNSTEEMAVMMQQCIIDGRRQGETWKAMQEDELWAEQAHGAALDEEV